MKQSNFIKIYIIPLLIISPFMVISCNSWFSIWMMMELNMMMFIPLIINLNKYFKELSFKYFIIQTISSTFLILMGNSMIINLNKYSISINLIMNLSLFMKLGFPPFQYWFINMMNNMTWLNCMLLSTWQKIIPMIMISYIYMKMINMMVILYSVILSAILSLNHQSLRIMMSYSSINHMSWMILNMMMNELIWKLYFFIYMSINLSIMSIFNLLNIFYINQMFTFNYTKLKIILSMNLLSLCGLPPLFGFNMKFMSMYFFSMNNFFIMNLIMIMMSIMTFIFYSRIILSFFILNSIKNKLMLPNKFINKNYIYYINILNFLNLWLISIYMF